MGDTGSLALGGGLGAVAILLKSEFVLAFVGAVFVAEMMSVIVQRYTFKYRKKRYDLEYAQDAPRLSPRAAAPSFRGAGLVGESGRRPVLDHRDSVRLLRPEHPQAAVTMERVLDAALPARWLRGEIAVVGLARSGRSAAHLLARAGAAVYASDAAASPDARRDRACAARRRRRTPTSAATTSTELRARRSSSRVPGVPPDAPPFVAGARGRRGHRERGRDRAAVSAAACVHRDHRHRTARPRRRRSPASCSRRSAAARRRRGTSARRSCELAALADAAGVGRARDLVVPAARHADRSIRRSACSRTSSANHLDRYASVERVLRRQDADVQERQARRRAGSRTPTTPDSERLTGEDHRRAPLSVLGQSEAPTAFYDRASDTLDRSRASADRARANCRCSGITTWPTRWRRRSR